MPTHPSHSSTPKGSPGTHGKIPESFIDELLDRVDLADIISSRVTLKRTGKNLMGLCPFHKEKTPSFSVNPEKQLYHCFSCNAAGNAIKFLMDLDNIPFPEAVEQLARTAGLEVPKDKYQKEYEEKRQQLAPLYELIDTAAQKFKHVLNSAEGTQALQYLKQRGLSQEVISLFNLGYAPSGWNFLSQHIPNPSHDKTLKNSSLKERYIQTGLVIEKDENRYYDRFRHRVIFPIRDIKGRTIAFGGRVLGDDKPKYLNSPETPVFHKNKELYGLYESKQHHSKLERLMVVEGYMDVLALFQHNICYSVATLGTATNGYHLEKIFRSTQEVVFCFDGDEAGRKAASRALDITLPHLKDGRQAKFLFLPEGEDPDTLVRKEGNLKFEQRIIAATPLPEQLFKDLADQIDLNTFDGKAKLHQLLQPKIQKIPSRLMQQLLQQHLSELTGLTQSSSQTSPSTTTRSAVAPSSEEIAIQKRKKKSKYTQYSHSQHPPSSDYSATMYPAAPQSDAWVSPKHSNHQHKILSNTESAIKIILQHPQLAETVNNEELLLSIDLENENTTTNNTYLLLKELVRMIKNGPTPTTAGILFHFYHHPHYRQLEHLAERENLLANNRQEDLEKHLSDAINKVLEEERGLLIKALCKKKSKLTDSEKKILQEHYSQAGTTS